MEKQKEYVNEETECINLYESPITDIDFSHYPSVLTFIIDWCEGNPVFMKFTDCSRIDFDLHENVHLQKVFEHPLIGLLEIQGFTFSKSSTGYIVQLNFFDEPMGHIIIECSQFSFTTYSKPLTRGGQTYSIYDDDTN